MPDFLSKASERIPTLAGIKFTNLDLMSYQRCLHSHDRGFDIPWGVDESYLAAIAFGTERLAAVLTLPRRSTIA